MTIRLALVSLFILSKTKAFGQPKVTVDIDGSSQIYYYNDNRLSYMRLENDSVHYYYHKSLIKCYVLYRKSKLHTWTAVDSLTYDYANGKLFDVHATSREIQYYAPKKPQILISNVSHGLDIELAYLELILSGESNSLLYINKRIQVSKGITAIYLPKKVDMFQIRGLWNGPFQRGSVIQNFSLHLVDRRLVSIFLTTTDPAPGQTLTKYKRVYFYDRNHRASKIVTYVLPGNVVESVTRISYK